MTDCSNRTLLFVLMVCSIYWVGCSSTLPEQSSTLIYSREGEADVLDPIQTEVGETVNVVVNIFEPLVTYAEKSTDIVGCLATDWSASEDGLTWTFELRKGVKFHDGTPFNADAVVFSLSRLIQDDHPQAYTEVKPFVATFQVIERMEAVNDHQVVFYLKYPDAVFLQNMCMFPASIVSPTAVITHEKQFGARPVGTGPFRMGRWDRDVELELLAFDGYWDGRPKLDRVIFIPGKESQVRRKRMLRGEAHIADNLPPQVIDELSKSPHLDVQTQTGMNVGYLSMQTEKPPLNDARVRHAIWHAIDKERLIAEKYYGHARPAVNMVPPTMWGHHDGLIDRDYSPDKSRQLLKEAGVQIPLKLKLFAMETARPYMQQPRETAIFIKNQLKQVGVEVDIIVQENNLHFQALNRGEHDLGLAGWSSDNNDPDNFLYQLLDLDNAHDHGNNNSRYRNQRFHELLMAGKREFDREKRKAIYHEAQEIAFNDAPTVPLVHTEMRIVQHQRVRDYYLHQASLVRLKWTWLADGSGGGAK